jgi:lipid-A-disaccharide synthase
MSAVGPRIFLSAGEPSGDLHGAAVTRALRARLPGAVLEAFGGPRMAEAGAHVLHPMERVAAFGTVEILTKLPAHVRLLKQLRRAFEAKSYDLVVLIDYPGFHLRVAEAARRAGIPVLYYIAPQLWAWWPERAVRFAKAVNRLAVILPFEAEFFAKLGLGAEYVGHPLLDRGAMPERNAARAALGIRNGERVLGLFPGSRHGEVRRMWGPFRQAARRLLDEGACQRAIVAGTTQHEYPDPGPVEVHRGDPLPVFSAADAAIAKSGTTTLEAALADTPMVVPYRAHPFTSWLSRRVLTVPYVSLVNLVAGRPLVPELLQDAVTPARLADAVRPLLDPANPATVAQRAGLREVRERLGSAGAAGRVADMAEQLLAAG